MIIEPDCRIRRSEEFQSLNADLQSFYKQGADGYVLEPKAWET